MGSGRMVPRGWTDLVSGESLASDRCVRVLVLLVGTQNMTQMPLANYNYVIQAFSSDRADQSFRIAVLPRRSRRCRSVANAHRSSASGKCLSVDAVPIANR